jgi:hypothetical protein
MVERAVLNALAKKLGFDAGIRAFGAYMMASSSEKPIHLLQTRPFIAISILRLLP